MTSKSPGLTGFIFIVLLPLSFAEQVGRDVVEHLPVLGGDVLLLLQDGNVCSMYALVTTL